jgi:ribosomal protein L9
LFVNKLAESATPEALKKLKARKAEHDKNEEELKKHLSALAHKISVTKIEFDLKADKTGALFGSVNKESVLKALREHNLVRKERVDIDLKYPIKEAGEYKVSVDFKKGVTAELNIIVKKLPR